MKGIAQKTINCKIDRRLAFCLLLAVIVALGICFSAEPAFAAKAPSKVTGVKIVNKDANRFDVSWKAARGAAKYEVQYKKAAAKKWKKSEVTKEKYVTVEVPSCDTKYQVRVRGIKGSEKGKWSDVKSVKTLLPAPPAIWAKYIGSTRIEVEWPAIEWPDKAKGRSYDVTIWDGTSDPGITYSTKATSYTFENLDEGVGNTFKVRAKSKDNKSRNTSIVLSTYGDDTVLAQHDPTSPWYSLTRFVQRHDTSRGSEYEIPAMWQKDVDAEGYVEQEGYTFPKYVRVDEITLYNVYICQGSMTVPITTQTQVKVGDRFTAPDGTETKVTGLRLQFNPNEVFEGCSNYKEAYKRIESYELYVETEDLGPNAVTIEWDADWTEY